MLASATAEEKVSLPPDTVNVGFDDPAIATTTPFPAVTLAPSVTVTDVEPVVLSLLASCTREGIAHHPYVWAWVMVNAETATVLPEVIVVVAKFRSAPDVPTLPVATTVVLSLLTSAK